MTEKHYENFPVASLLLPKKLRPAVSAVYAFARTADDFADEGERSDEERLRLLEGYRQELENLSENSPPPFSGLWKLKREYGLAMSHFYDLLDAFSQDVVKKRYRDFPELLAYCERSANPVGRIMLGLFEAVTPQNIELSDKICTSLQIINFLQDVAIDFAKERIYLPADELARFGVSEEDIANGVVDESWRALIRFQSARAREMMLAGSPLCKRLPGRIGFELRLVVQGGLRILERLEKNGCDMFGKRPKLGAPDWGIMFLRALVQ